MTEEIFVRAWRDLPELPAPDGFGPWFSRIVDETCRTAAIDPRRGKVRELSGTAGPAGAPTSGTLRRQILERVATTKQRSGPRPAAVAAASLEHPTVSRRAGASGSAIGIPVIVAADRRARGHHRPADAAAPDAVQKRSCRVRPGRRRLHGQRGRDGSDPRSSTRMGSRCRRSSGRRTAGASPSTVTPGAILYDTSTGATTHIGGTQPRVLAGRPADRRHRFRRGRAPAPPAGRGVGGRDEAPGRHDRRPRVVTRWPMDRGSRIGRQPRHRRIHQLREAGRVEWTGPRRRSGHARARRGAPAGLVAGFVSRRVQPGHRSPATDAGATRCAIRTSSRQTRTGPGSCS